MNSITESRNLYMYLALINSKTGLDPFAAVLAQH